MGLLNVIRSMTEWAIEVVLQIPLFETFSMEHVQTFEFSDFLAAQDRLEANNAVNGTVSGEQLASVAANSAVGCKLNVPYEVAINTFGR